MRAYIAIKLSQNSLNPLLRAQGELEQKSPGVYAWTDLERVHLTLYFLGEMSAQALELVSRALDEDARAEPFQLGWGGQLVLPSPDVPKILAAGVIGDKTTLATLQRRIHDLVFPHAENKETRAFFPHATIGRLKRGIPPSAKIVKRTLAGFALPDGELEQVTGFDLMGSEISSNGVQHTLLKRFDFPEWS